MRWVTGNQAKKHPLKVALGQKICSKCRKMLPKLPVEKESPPMITSNVVEEEFLVIGDFSENF